MVQKHPLVKTNYTPVTGNDIWDRYFMVKMLYLHSRSVEQIREYGVRISGVPEIDRDLDKQEIVTQANINMMFEKHRMGVTVRVVNYNDTAVIYKIIHSHLIAWVEYLSSGINVDDAPLKDLIELDAFAATVYKHAKCVFGSEERVSAISTNFRNIQAFNFHNILKRSQEVEEVRATPDGIVTIPVANQVRSNVPGDRSSYKDAFARELARIEGWRGEVGK